MKQQGNIPTVVRNFQENNSKNHRTEIISPSRSYTGSDLDEIPKFSFFPMKSEYQNLHSKNEGKYDEPCLVHAMINAHDNSFLSPI